MCVQGKKVRVVLPSLIFDGEIVGKVSDQPIIGALFLVRCTDSTLPNAVYEYDTCIVPETHICDPS